MGSPGSRLMLLEQILRLRRVERAHPEDRDVVEVRLALEQEVGPTVSLATAARLLEVSHTTVGRWVRAGEIPQVMEPSGREGIPVRALLRLVELVRAERDRGTRSLHLLEEVLGAQHARAAALDPAELLDPAALDVGPGDPHERARLTNLAYHRAVAARLSPAMITEALHRVWEWRQGGLIDPAYARAWEQLLEQPAELIAQEIGADGGRGDDLRQNSPFAGALSQAERSTLLAAIA